MAKLLTTYKDGWAEMREHVCLEARWGELGAQIAALKGADALRAQERARLTRLKDQLRECKRVDELAARCAGMSGHCERPGSRVNSSAPVSAEPHAAASMWRPRDVAASPAQASAGGWHTPS